jgi:hypothetical protein
MTKEDFAGKINLDIKKMLSYESKDEEKNNDKGNIGYDTQFDLIKHSFTVYPSRELQLEDVATRLSLLDLFYTTNFNRFVEFGLHQLANVIWNLCEDPNGFHSDATLVDKVEKFVRDCSDPNKKAEDNEVFKQLLDDSVKFGLVRVEEEKEEEKEGVPIGNGAQSLVSKYLFFLLENNKSSNLLGFPIYDSIAKNLQNPMLKKLGIKVQSDNSVIGYVKKMSAILDCLMHSANNGVWQLQNSRCNTRFGLLDYFLWRVGKCGTFSFSLLWSNVEKKKYYITAKNLQKKLKNSVSPQNTKDFDHLPSRFKDWYNVYISIKR